MQLSAYSCHRRLEASIASCQAHKFPREESPAYSRAIAFQPEADDHPIGRSGIRASLLLDLLCTTHVEVTVDAGALTLPIDVMIALGTSINTMRSHQGVLLGLFLLRSLLPLLFLLFTLFGGCVSAALRLAAKPLVS